MIKLNYDTYPGLYVTMIRPTSNFNDSSWAGCFGFGKRRNRTRRTVAKAIILRRILNPHTKIHEDILHISH